MFWIGFIVGFVGAGAGAIVLGWFVSRQLAAIEECHEELERDKEWY